MQGERQTKIQHLSLCKAFPNDGKKHLKLPSMAQYGGISKRPDDCLDRHQPIQTSSTEALF